MRIERSLRGTESMNNLTLKVKKLCERFGIKPDVDLKDQHFLVNGKAIDAVVKAADIKPTNSVIEVGPGLGHLTEELANRAKSVLAIEIDRQFEGPLREVQKRRPNLEVVYKNVLETELPSCDKIVASLPFSILEPFITKLTKARFKLATLVTGKRFAYEVEAQPENHNYGKLSALVQGRFEAQKVTEIDKSSFWPKPRVNTAIINLEPQESKELREEPVKFVMGEVILQPDKKVKNALREAIIRFDELRGRRGTKRRAREMISKLGLSSEILEKMPEQLSNRELRSIGKSLRVLKEG